MLIWVPPDYCHGRMTMTVETRTLLCSTLKAQANVLVMLGRLRMQL